MNQPETLVQCLEKFKSQNTNFHLTFEKKKTYLRLKVEALRDQIAFKSSQLELDDVIQIEKQYELKLNEFLDEQRKIERIIEQNKHLVIKIDEPESFDSNELAVSIRNLNAAISDLKTTQNRIEQLEFINKFETINQTLSNIEIKKVNYKMFYFLTFNLLF